ncbi:MAG TPA: twin-arginine translocase TatA/TatE family subunit [Acidimicrobiales bacterium]|nr:twin-arginine translocase TatA/TatE family subunit [Acidimicrobiales bacterium]
MLAMLSESTILIVAIVLVVLFGGSQLPKLARNVGTAGKEFRKAQADAEAEHARAAVVTPPAVPASTDDDRITLSRAELDALLAEREGRAKGTAGTD